MSNICKSESNLPADFNCEENDQVGSRNLIDNASHLKLLPDCGNPGKLRETPTIQATPENVPRKLLTMHRKLMVYIKRSHRALLKCKIKAQLDQESSKIFAITRAHDNFICAIKGLKDDDLLEALSSDVTECLQKFSDLYHECRLRICDKSEDKICEVSHTNEEETNSEPCDSVSQVDSRYSATSNKPSVVKRIELQKKRAELENVQELAKAKARKMRMLAEADEAEALAKVRLKMVNIDAEKQLLACSESGSSIVALSKTSKTKSVFRRRVGSEILAEPSATNHVHFAIKIERCAEFNFDTYLSAKTPSFVPVKPDQGIAKQNPAINRIYDRTNRVNAWLNNEIRQEAPVRIEPEIVAPKLVQETKYRDCGAAKVPDLAPINADRKPGASLPSQTHGRAKRTLSSIDNYVVNLLTYLDRQGRIEYITLASQIAYDFSNITFVFYENQI